MTFSRFLLWFVGVTAVISAVTSTPWGDVLLGAAAVVVGAAIVAHVFRFLFRMAMGLD
jgi:hypothetical protein